MEKILRVSVGYSAGSPTITSTQPANKFNILSKKRKRSDNRINQSDSGEDHQLRHNATTNSQPVPLGYNPSSFLHHHQRQHSQIPGKFFSYILKTTTPPTGFLTTLPSYTKSPPLQTLSYSDPSYSSGPFPPKAVYRHNPLHLRASLTVSLNRDPRPQFSELRQFSGSNGLATRLAKGIQGQPNSLNLARIASLFQSRQTTSPSEPRPQLAQRTAHTPPSTTLNTPSTWLFATHMASSDIDPMLFGDIDVEVLLSSPTPNQQPTEKGPETEKQIRKATKTTSKNNPKEKENQRKNKNQTKANKKKRNTDQNMEDEYTSKKEEEEEEENDDDDLIKDTPKKKNPNWRIEEDESLCKSWLNTSKDSITGNGQTSDSFWDQIHKLYLGLIDKVIEKKKAESHSESKGFKPFTTRNKKALESRWYHIQHQAIEAKLLFKNEIGKKFGLDHCWGILHNAQKWLDHLNEANGRKSKNNNDNPSSVGNMSSTTEESRTGRPEGQKTAKKRKNEEITLEKLVKGQRELLDISRQKVKSFKSYINNMIMCQSLEGMDQETLEFFQAKRRKVIANAKANT
ncbi:hypothetical protein MJO28_017940 [Puccinia striiformis f. sp. tritici]|nr:hypothetical protein MJO28_017940 [Puccinia striiformis f. sp. tritici]